MQEYPKALYLAGVMAMAANADQEHDLREDGYAEWHVDQKRMQRVDSGAAPEPAKPDTSALDEAKAQLMELESHLMAKDHDLTAKERELAARETELAQAQADLAARLAVIDNDASARADAPATPPAPPADEKASARSRKKPDAAQ